MAKKVDNVREERIKGICAAINKSPFGGEEHDAVTWLGSREPIELERFSSGCEELDEALGGGWPKGRFIEVFGPESGGKTTLVLHAIAEHQKKYPNEEVGLVDVEFSFDEDYATKLGVNTKYLIVNQPSSGKQALNVTRQLILAGVKLIVFDSVAALTTENEMEADLGDQKMAEQARMMSPALRALTSEAGPRKVTIFFTNQVREKIGIMYGDKTTTPAGKALKHYASIRAQISRIGTVKEKIDGEDVVVSAKTKVDIKKNKTAAPFRKAEFCISFGHGIDQVAAVLDAAITLGVIEKRGAYLAFDGVQLGQGRAVVMEMMRTDEELFKKVTEFVVAAKVSGKKSEDGEEKTKSMKRPSFSKRGSSKDDADEPEEVEDGKVIEVEAAEEATVVDV